MASLWRRVPAPLLLACGIELATGLVWFARTLGQSEHELVYGAPAGDPWWIASSGVGLVVGVLLLIGLLWLAGRLSGIAAVGAKLAAAGIGMRIAIQLAWLALEAHISLHPTAPPFLAQRVLQLGMTVAALVTVVGLGLATRRWWAVAAGAVLAILISPPWFLGELYGQFIHSIRDQYLLIQGGALVWACLELGLVLLACRDARDESRDEGSAPGLGRVAFALRGRVIAAMILGCLGLLFVGPADGRAVMELYAIVSLSGVAIELALLIVLALGALACVRGDRDLPAWPMVVSAAAALWTSGALLQKLGSLYLMLVERRSWSGVSYDPFAHVSATTTALVAAGAVAGVLISLTMTARRRGFDDLRQHLVARTGWFVGLALTAIAIEYWLGVPFAQTLVVALIRIAAAVLAIAALGIAASACGDAARALSSEPGLPAARVVRS